MVGVFFGDVRNGKGGVWKRNFIVEIKEFREVGYLLFVEFRIEFSREMYIVLVIEGNYCVS